MSAERSITLSALFLCVAVATAPADDLTSTWQPTPLVSDGQSVTLLPGACDCCSDPCLQFTADLLILGRGGPDARGLLYDLGSGAELLNTEKLGMSAEAGLRLGLIFFDESGYDLEFGYLGTDRFASTRTRSSELRHRLSLLRRCPAQPVRYLQRRTTVRDSVRVSSI